MPNKRRGFEKDKSRFPRMGEVLEGKGLMSSAA